MPHYYIPTTLTETLRSSHEQRTKFIYELQVDVRRRLAQQSAAIHEQGTSQRSARQQFHSELSRRVSDQCADMAHARERMAQMQELRLSGWHHDLQDSVARLLAGYAESRGRLSQAQREQLEQAVAAIRLESAQLIEHYSANRPRSLARPSLQAQAVRADQIFAQPLPATASEPARHLSHAGANAYAQLARVSILKELDAQREQLGHGTRDQIDAFVDGLRANIATLRHDLNQRRGAPSEPNEHIDALRKTCQALRHDLDSFANGLGPQTPYGLVTYVAELRITIAAMITGLDGASQPPEGDQPGRASTRRRGEDIRDDLTAIRGIGKSLEQRLNQAGIYTFIQIALSTPDDLRKIFGSTRVANLDEWVAKARDLAGMPR